MTEHVVGPLDRLRTCSPWSLLGTVVLIAWCLLYAKHSFDFSLPPYEDAAMLMRYSEHVAQGHGIVWNIGATPVDGATDFLYMISLAALRWFGVTIETASRVLIVSSHVLTCAIVFVAVRRLHAAPYWMAAFSAAFVAGGPALRYLEAFFGTPYFALFGATTWYVTYRIFRDGVTTRRAALFSLSALVFGLVRPEGVLIGVIFLVALGLTRGWTSIRRLCLVYLVVFGVPGALYFAWRWSYFGHPLPNPYYIKGHGAVHWGQALVACEQVLRLTLPFVPVFVFGSLAAAGRRFFGSGTDRVRARRDWDEAVFVMTPLVLYVAIAVLHEGLMDYCDRFAYWVLPVAAISWPALLSISLRVQGRIPVRPVLGVNAAGRLLVVVLFVGALGHQVLAYSRRPFSRWGTYDLARILSEYDHGYTMAVTNAGQLPLISGWNVIDAWGLNDHAIASNGLTDALLESERPELIQFDVRFTPLTEESVELRPSPWSRASLTMKAFAERQNYVLAATYGTSVYSSHYYYVRRDFADSAELVQRIRGMEYIKGGRVTVDFSAAQRKASTVRR